MLLTGRDLPIVQVQFGFVRPLHQAHWHYGFSLCMTRSTHSRDTRRPLFTATLSVDARGHTGHDGHKIIYQLVLCLRGKQHFNVPSLRLEQLPDVFIAKAGESVSMFDNQRAHGGVGQQLAQFWAMIIQSRRNFAHLVAHLITSCSGIVTEALHLALEVAFLLSRRHPRIERDPSGGNHGHGSIPHHHRARRRLIRVELSRLPPAPRRLIAHTDTLGILTQFHVYILPYLGYMCLYVYR